MGTAIGYFYDLNNDSYRLSISASGITNGSITLGEQPVLISYDKGDCKFGGLRTVRATINLVTSTDMSSFYADSATSHSVSIEKYTDSSWKAIYKGYLIPFTLQTSYQLSNDVLQLEAVDAISALKTTMYKRTSGSVNSKGVTWIAKAMSKAGISKLIVHENFGISSSATETKQNIEKLYIPDQAFLPDGLIDEPSVSYADIVSYISQFMGLSAILWGDALYLVDHYALAHQSQFYNATEYTISNGGIAEQITYTSTGSSPIYDLLTLTAQSFRGTANKHYIGQAYNKRVISLENSKKATLLADVYGETFTQKILTQRGNYRYKIDFCADSLVDWHIFQNGAEVAKETAIANIGSFLNSYDWVGAIPVNVTWWRADNPTSNSSMKCILVHVYPQSLGETTLFSINDKALGRMADNSKFVVGGDIMTRSGGTPADSLVPPIDGDGDTGTTRLPYLYLKSYAKYYIDGTTSTDTSLGVKRGEWSYSVGSFPVVFGSDGQTGQKKAIPSYHSLMKVPPSGEWEDYTCAGNLSLYWKQNVSTSSQVYTAWIGLSIGYPNEDTKEQVIKETANTVEELNVSAGLTAVADSKQAVSTDTWSGNYCAKTADATRAIDKYGVISEQLDYYKTNQKNYELVLADTIQPWTKVTFQGETYTVDAMEWDVANGVKTITIN